MFKWKDIQTIIGVDQTGAVASNGRPKPLFAAKLTKFGKNIEIETNLRLASLRENEIAALLTPHDKGTILIVVDSVLGLPATTGVGFDQVVSEAAQFNFEGREYGAMTAVKFFQRYLSNTQISNASYPKRWAEELAKANSVFQLKPYQRNIGCGTYRVLKELGQGRKWFDVWPFEEKPTTRFIIAEGYPSLFWRNILGEKKRQPEILNEYLKQNFSKVSLPATKDDADAAVLAIGAYKTIQSGYLNRFDSSHIHQNEGWILGLDVPKDR